MDGWTDGRTDGRTDGTPSPSGNDFLVAICVVTNELLGALWFDALHLGLEKVFAFCTLNCYLLCLVGKQMFSEARPRDSPSPQNKQWSHMTTVTFLK